VVILNSPYQSGGYEGPEHLNAKIAVAEIISQAGYVVEYERSFWMENQPADRPFRVDIYLPAHQVYIEIDGSTHGSKRAKSKDEWKDECLESLGQTGIRLSLTEAEGAPEQILAYLPELKLEESTNR
jgi:very-short-patch-repair endonuclease